MDVEWRRAAWAFVVEPVAAGVWAMRRVCELVGALVVLRTYLEAGS